MGKIEVPRHGGRTKRDKGAIQTDAPNPPTPLLRGAFGSLP